MKIGKTSWYRQMVVLYFIYHSTFNNHTSYFVHCGGAIHTHADKIMHLFTNLTFGLIAWFDTQRQWATTQNFTWNSQLDDVCIGIENEKWADLYKYRILMENVNPFRKKQTARNMENMSKFMLNLVLSAAFIESLSFMEVLPSRLLCDF